MGEYADILNWDAVRTLVLGASDGCDAAIGRNDQHWRLCGTEIHIRGLCVNRWN